MIWLVKYFDRVQVSRGSLMTPPYAIVAPQVVAATREREEPNLAGASWEVWPRSTWIGSGANPDSIVAYNPKSARPRGRFGGSQ